MGKRVGRYPEAFRRMAVERKRNCANISALARELEIDRTVLYHWQRLAGEQGTPTLLKNQRDDNGESALLQSVKG